MSGHFDISPEVETRIAAWIKHHWNVVDASTPAIKPCITLAREIGCEVYEIAAEVQTSLSDRSAHEPTPHSWIIVNRQVVEKMLAEATRYASDVEQADKLNPLLHSLFTLLLGRHIAAEHDLHEQLKASIRHFVGIGDCILVDCAAAAVTQELEHCLNVRLVAPLTQRLRNVMRAQSLSEREAAAYIEREDKRNEEFNHRFAGHRLDEPWHFDITLNTARLNPRNIADLIVKGLETKGLI